MICFSLYIYNAQPFTKLLLVMPLVFVLPAYSEDGITKNYDEPGILISVRVVIICSLHVSFMFRYVV